MKRFRVSIAVLMTMVGVVALNLGVLRTLYATRQVDILLGGTMMSVILQVAVFRALRKRGQNRSFWMGFAGGGTLASLSLVASILLPHSVMGTIWQGYGGIVGGLVDRWETFLVRGLRNYPLMIDLAFSLFITAIEFVPLVLAALIGGLLTRQIAKRRGTPYAAIPSPTPDSDNPPDQPLSRQILDFVQGV